MRILDKEQDNRVLSMQQVIKNLRADNLIHGYPFMVFDDDLPDGEAYYEYPDGTIQIEQIDPMNIDIPRYVIKMLNEKEVAALRQKYEVFR